MLQSPIPASNQDCFLPENKPTVRNSKKGPEAKISNNQSLKDVIHQTLSQTSQDLSETFPVCPAWYQYFLENRLSDSRDNKIIIMKPDTIHYGDSKNKSTPWRRSRKGARSFRRTKFWEPITVTCSMAITGACFALREKQSTCSESSTVPGSWTAQCLKIRPVARTLDF